MNGRIRVEKNNQRGENGREIVKSLVWERINI